MTGIDYRQARLGICVCLILSGAMLIYGCVDYYYYRDSWVLQPRAHRLIKRMVEEQNKGPPGIKPPFIRPNNARDVAICEKCAERERRKCVNERQGK